LKKLTFGHDKSRNTGRRDGGDDGVPLLGDADLAVPPAVGLGGREHVAASTHVTVSSLNKIETTIKQQNLTRVRFCLQNSKFKEIKNCNLYSIN
jgi:hypothetical protein